ncbi:MAG: hypothetical protein JO165_05305 [Candidatus Eremiobacteraeota bacterium]|nr:hypothetical protein [Candidatus Eremiobacteraeota bacterium]
MASYTVGPTVAALFDRLKQDPAAQPNASGAQIFPQESNAFDKLLALNLVKNIADKGKPRRVVLTDPSAEVLSNNKTGKPKASAAKATAIKPSRVGGFTAEDVKALNAVLEDIERVETQLAQEWREGRRGRFEELLREIGSALRNGDLRAARKSTRTLHDEIEAISSNPRFRERAIRELRSRKDYSLRRYLDYFA